MEAKPGTISSTPGKPQVTEPFADIANRVPAGGEDQSRSLLTQQLAQALQLRVRTFLCRLCDRDDGIQHRKVTQLQVTRSSVAREHLPPDQLIAELSREPAKRRPVQRMSCLKGVTRVQEQPAVALERADQRRGARAGRTLQDSTNQCRDRLAARKAQPAHQLDQGCRRITFVSCRLADSGDPAWAGVLGVLVLDHQLPQRGSCAAARQSQS